MSAWIVCPNPSCRKESPAQAESAEGTWVCPSCGQANGRVAASETRSTGTLGEANLTRSYAFDGGSTEPQSDRQESLPAHIGRFEIRRLLGEGTFGKVFEANDPLLDRPVALKVAKLERGDSAERIKRFLREAKVAANLRHPHIVPLYEFAQEGDQFFIASAFIRGRTLKEAIDEAKHAPLTTAPLTPDSTTHHAPLTTHQSARIVRQMAEALAYAHEQGIVHRDIKPANTMLDERDEPMVMDFGLATRQEEDEQLTHAGQVMGTPLYMAPEQARGKEGAPLPASDQYSLGIILYELLTGKRPFEGAAELVMFHHQQTEPSSPRKVNPQVPRDLETICLKCLEKDPARRYPDCQALAEDLRRWLADEPILAKKMGPGRRLVRWCRKNKAVASLVALVGLAIILGGAFSLYFGIEATERAKEAEQAKDRAVKEKLRADHEVYIADMRLAQYAWERNNLANVYRLIMAHVPKTPDDPDFRGFEWGYWHHVCHEGRVILTGPDKPVGEVLFAPSGQAVAAACEDGTARVWDPSSGKELACLRGHSGVVRGIAFSSDSTQLATGGGDGFRIWDWRTGEQLVHEAMPAGRMGHPSSSARRLSRGGVQRRPVGGYHFLRSCHPYLGPGSAPRDHPLHRPASHARVLPPRRQTTDLGRLRWRAALVADFAVKSGALPLLE